MPVLSVNGTRLYYDICGLADPHTPAVVFLHGMGSSSADWSLQVPVFAERYRVITLDLRTHGQSADPGDWFTVEMLADDVAALLGQLGEPAVYAIGLSLGGCVALALALRHPACVRSLTLVNAFARYQPVGARGFMRQARRLWLLLTAPMPAVAAYIADGLFPKPEQRPYYDAALASLSRNRKRTYFAAMRALAVFDVRRHLSHLRCPTLIVAGERDGTVTLPAQHLLRQSIPGAQLLVVPDSGHATPYDQAEIFNRAVLDFLAAH